jgi:excisionase family DNA binding protein
MKKHAERRRIAPAVMTVKELSGYLHLHPTTIYRLLRKGQIPGFRIDGDWRFHIKAIDEWRSQKEAGSNRRRSVQGDKPGNEGKHSDASKLRLRAQA